MGSITPAGRGRSAGRAPGVPSVPVGPRPRMPRWRSGRLRRAAASILAAALLAGGALAALPIRTLAAGPYFVASWGSDSGRGSATSPWRTLQKAADAVPPGATVYVRAGTYAGFAIDRSGTSAARIRVMSFPGERAVLRGDADHPAVVRISGAHWLILANLTIRDAPARWGAGVRVDRGSSHVTLTGLTLTHNDSFGVEIADSTYVTVKGSRITRNETGIQVSRAGTGVVISGNTIAGNDRMIVDDATPDNDRGANGVVLYRTTGRVTIRGNVLYGNRAPSHDYGEDGGAFEIYAASNALITGNRMWDNENVLETGTDGTSCQGNVFTRNVADGRATWGQASGMILRCAASMLVVANTFYGLDRFVFDVSTAGRFAGSVAGLRIEDNIAVQRGAKVFSIDTTLPSTVVVDHDLVRNDSGGSIAYVAGRGNTDSLATFRNWTGYERSGLQADPRFASRSALDLRLTAASPAIDRGTVIQGVTTVYRGSAPDIGRWEFGL